MPIATALIFCAIVLALALIGLLWAIALLLPFYAYIAIATYLIWRSQRRNAELRARIQQEAEQQRGFNEQEMRAWLDSLEEPDLEALRKNVQPRPSNKNSGTNERDAH